ncbi:MAG: single-stranded DNA-binding protein [Clostridiales bacterium]|nr:single-stranded DNA-binding protein [Clostridia bacterium]MCR5353261.1 single-stranded DNA-binding protein [Clostridiales bacterium]
MASLNKVILMGNLTADPELKTTPSGISVTSFSIAVGRRFAKETDEVKADFINIVCWRGTAEFVTKYFSKGRSIVVVGELQTRSYTAQDGSKRYITEVVANEVTFGASSSGAQREKSEGTYYGGEPISSQAKVSDANFEELSAEDDLPF